MTLSINSHFDSGNIITLSADECSNIRLAIRNDRESEFLQWFHFSASGIRGQACTFSIDNAGATTYPKGWEGYAVATSADRQHWYRTPAEFDGERLVWRVTPDTDILWFAYFAPYSMDQHADLIAAAACAPGVQYECLGLTHEGRCIDYLKVSDLPGFDVSSNESSHNVPASAPENGAGGRGSGRRKQLWVIARQHPGESMTEWFMEGWLDRLLDRDDSSSRALRAIADIHVVPNMNPDGSILGHLRTNALGVNLNREWASPSLARSPEVFHVRARMQLTGVDLSLDVHGDEALPYNFIAGTEGVKGWNETRDAELASFKQTMAALNPDFQYVHGYPRNPPGNANLAMCSNNLAGAFGCLAMTLEMPFKDTADTPRPDTGWSPERSMRLGASFVDAIYLAVTNRLIVTA